jgi:hypothetical protein
MTSKVAPIPPDAMANKLASTRFQGKMAARFSEVKHGMS